MKEMVTTKRGEHAMRSIDCLYATGRFKNEMKKLLFGTILLALPLVFPAPTNAEVNVGINISLPLPVVFAAPPEMVVIPETYVYVVPDVDVDIFFYNGWWWRPWEGRWYRSRDYGSGWSHYGKVPSFYGRIPSGWRDDYRQHRWGEHQWDHQRIPHEQVKRNWRTWEKNKHWEKQQTWGVKGLKTRKGDKHRSQDVQQHQSQPQHDEEQKKSKSKHGKGEKEKHGGK